MYILNDYRRFAHAINDEASSVDWPFCVLLQVRTCLLMQVTEAFPGFPPTKKLAPKCFRDGESVVQPFVTCQILKLC